MLPRSLLLRHGLMLTLALGPTTEAVAAAQRTFVASTGSDANVCSLAFPCRSFGVAIAQTLPGGEVIVLDSAGYGPAMIAQPVSIIAPPGIYAGISVTTGTGLDVNVASGNVALRGLTINSLGGTTGIAFGSGSALYVDNVTVSNFPGAGLAASLGGSGSVFVTRSTFHDNGTGAAFGASAGTVTVAIDGSLFARNGTGVVLPGRCRRLRARVDRERRRHRSRGRAPDRHAERGDRSARLHDLRDVGRRPSTRCNPGLR